jgi:hypothetical protein
MDEGKNHTHIADDKTKGKGDNADAKRYSPAQPRTVPLTVQPDGRRNRTNNGPDLKHPQKDPMVPITCEGAI